MKIVVCPRCHGALEPEERQLYCRRCQTGYPVQDGIAVLIAPEARSTGLDGGAVKDQPEHAPAPSRDAN